MGTHLINLPEIRKTLYEKTKNINFHENPEFLLSKFYTKDEIWLYDKEEDLILKLKKYLKYFPNRKSTSLESYLGPYYEIIKEKKRVVEYFSKKIETGDFILEKIGLKSHYTASLIKKMGSKVQKLVTNSDVYHAGQLVIEDMESGNSVVKKLHSLDDCIGFSNVSLKELYFFLELILIKF